MPDAPADPAACEVCRRPSALREYDPHTGAPRGLLCLRCVQATRTVEADLARVRRVLGYIKKYARLALGSPAKRV